MVVIGEHFLTTEDFKKLLYGGEMIEISSEAKGRVSRSFDFLRSFHRDKIIYGINTGLGPMAQYRIEDEDRINLQYNAIRSHASGCGQPVDPVYVRSSLIVLLNNFLQGHSGIHPEVVELISRFINNDISPVVPEHGGVGASGDLVQLAHIALALIGEGDVNFGGRVIPAAEAMRKSGLEPIKVHIREGLSLINGTCFMTGTGMVNIIHARNLVSWALIASAMINEIVHSCDDSFSKELNEVKKHPGQRDVARVIREILADSNLIRKRENEFYNNNHNHTKKILNDKVQEYYSIRCVPQIAGPVLDTIRESEKVLLNEANSSCDNPMIDDENLNIYHGGNFHGDYVSFEMDKVKIAVAKLSLLIDRQINYLMNDKLNNILPPFVNLGKLGVNFGMQGAQFTSTSTVAENQSVSFPNYLHSIPNNNDNQDIVSMGTNSALLARRVIDNTYQVLAIQMLSLVQAIDYLRIEDNLSSRTRQAYRQIRDIVPVFVEDTVKYPEIRLIKDFLFSRLLSFFD
ncbi:MAG TPA: aromatic amino acid ammonia-lyase [Bacteroidales bacterium]|nr:aromatic amino acid lyase [Bacteroidales bacterium]HNR41476.1 aromatic amino acid ammonia-lyase [Bacteroidales bacterium]HPM17825.1 aromatic amino acid ammonia-lyase [Bacteroidales bacterium]